ncbi:MAG: hypothetical protein NVSMB9_34550 [Isosphaeraceae bacterium]
MMSKTQRRTAMAALATVTLSAWAMAAQEPPLPPDTPAPVIIPDPRAGEKIGGTLDRAAGAVRRGVRGTAETVRDQFARARTAVKAMNVQSRVYSRLHWDKSLNDADIVVDVTRDGLATLRGTVVDPIAKARAIELASDTVGVTRVLDELTLLSPAPGTTIVPAPGTTIVPAPGTVRPVPRPRRPETLK